MNASTTAFHGTDHAAITLPTKDKNSCFLFWAVFLLEKSCKFSAKFITRISFAPPNSPLIFKRLLRIVSGRSSNTVPSSSATRFLKQYFRNSKLSSLVAASSTPFKVLWISNLLRDRLLARIKISSNVSAFSKPRLKHLIMRIFNRHFQKRLAPTRTKTTTPPPNINIVTNKIIVSKALSTVEFPYLSRFLRVTHRSRSAAVTARKEVGNKFYLGNSTTPNFGVRSFL
ncbi:MAG: hypothetical protein RLZZ601_636 [Pseudomonadota bacterium]